MRAWINRWLESRSDKRPDQRDQELPEARVVGMTLAGELSEARAREDRYRADYVERAAELIEARQMAGAGPWLGRHLLRASRR